MEELNDIARAYGAAYADANTWSEVRTAAQALVNLIARAWPEFGEAFSRVEGGQSVRRPRESGDGEDAQRVTMQRINMALGSM